MNRKGRNGKQRFALRLLLLLLAVAAFSLTGCDFIEGLYHPNAGEEGDGDGDGGKVYAIGDPGPGGGMIFYVSDEKGFKNTVSGKTCHYLEASPADMTDSGGNEFAWASAGFASVSIDGAGARETDIGTGAANTAAILKTDTNAPAAKACDVYTHDGKDDWFLPSKDELYELYRNHEAIDPTGDFSLKYWSSSEYTEGEAWFQGVRSGEQDMNFKVGGDMPVRAVRAF